MCVGRDRVFLSGAVLHEAAVTSRLLNWLDSNVKIR